MIIGLTGRKGSGKDSACEKTVGWQKLSFAEPVKEICRYVFGLSKRETDSPYLKDMPLDRWPFDSPRKLMQVVGTDMFRNAYPDVWVKRFMRTLGSRNVIVTDVRFQNEVDAIKERGGYVVKIVRPNLQKTDLHSSETGIDSLQVDATIVNDLSKDHLHKEFQKFIESVL
jgi:hypothetical protein